MAGAASAAQATENGRHASRGARFAFLLCLLTGTLHAAPPPSLEEVTRARNAGAVELALSMVDRGQPAPDQGLESWMEWERQRAAILRSMADWDGVASRLERLPDRVPPDFLLWAKTKRAEALIEAGDAVAARRQLAALIWSGEGSGTQLKSWRRLVIESYLAAGARQDAYVAMVRYHQDYGRGDVDSAFLRARVLLASGLPEDAAALLEGLESRRARLLLLLARQRAGSGPAKALAEKAAAIGRDESLEPAECHLAWAVAAEAARAAGDHAAAAIALEYLFGGTSRNTLPAGLFELTPAMLWDAYSAYAERVGNREQLLLGDDAAWFAAAENTEARFPIRIRSIFGLLAQRAYGAGERDRAHARLVASLVARPDGAHIVRQLYLSAPDRFADVRSVPVAARRVLIDLAIAENDLALASELQEGLTEPPPGADRVMWQLRRAKIFILGGAPDRGAEVLNQLLDTTVVLTADQTDRLVQVVFDLQNVGEHEAAVALFERLLERTGVSPLRRELLFWAADSYRAMGEHRNAARRYLDSATALDAAVMDPWAQTARYQAAAALADAGLVEDARRLLERLLAVTEDRGRRAVLQRDLQQLWLKR